MFRKLALTAMVAGAIPGIPAAVHAQAPPQPRAASVEAVQRAEAAATHATSADFAAPAGTLTAEQRIEAAFQQAVAAGIPVGLLEARRAEGRAKGVPLDRIAAAVEHRLEMLARAATVFEQEGRAPGTAELAAGAAALEAGVSQAALASVAATAPREQRAVAIAVLTHLVQQGIPVDAALGRVDLALAGRTEIVVPGLVLRARAGTGAGERGGRPGAGDANYAATGESIQAAGIRDAIRVEARTGARVDASARVGAGR